MEAEFPSVRPQGNAVRRKLSVIVIHYNDPENLSACLDALQHDSAIDQIVVVDNSSDAEAVAAITALCSRVQVVWSRTNLGFGGGANLGAERSDGEFLVFLNPDTVPDLGCMGALAKHLSTYNGVVGPIVRTGPAGTPEYGYTADRMLLLRGMDKPGEPLFVSGCCLATTRSCFDAVGGFDARYFLFQEDVEFCWQALRRGFSVATIPGAGLVHIGGTAAAGGYHRAGRIETSSNRILLRERNAWAVVIGCVPIKHIPQMLTLSILRTLSFTGILVFYGRVGDVFKLWKGVLWNIANLRATIGRRLRPGVTRRGEQAAWERIERQFFLWDLARRGERLRFVDTKTAGAR